MTNLESVSHSEAILAALAGSPGTNTFGAISPGTHRKARYSARAGSFGFGRFLVSGHAFVIIQYSSMRNSLNLIV